MKQSKRVSHLIKLLESREFESHEELLETLSAQGVPSTQATLSRDLNRLGIQKVHGMYTLRGHSKIRIDAAGPNLLVVKTTGGGASALAAEIDGWDIAGLIGTVAGDDTIFIASKDVKSQLLIHKTLLEMQA
ncbi:MAG: arginine repressor [Myxococcota bacterium]